MKKGLILYKSKYGATGQYANWLSTELHLPCIDADKITDELLEPYEFVVIGSPVYYGELLAGSLLKKHFAILKTKKLFLFIVCATPDSSEKEQDKILKENVPKALCGWDNIYFLPGRLIPEKLQFFDRAMLRIATFFEKDSVRKKVMLNGFDSISKNNLIDLFLAVKIHLMSHKHS